MLPVVIAVDALTLILTIYAIVAPAYHYNVVTLLTGASITFDIGLQRVKVRSNPYGIAGKRKFLKWPAAALKNIQAQLNNKSLSEIEALACYVENLTWGGLGDMCESVVALKMASYVMLTVLYIAAASCTLGFLLLLYRLMKRGTSMQRRTAMMFHIIPAVVILMGSIVYLMIGGLNANLLPSIPMLIMDSTPVDLGGGFFVAVGAAISAIVGVALLFFCKEPGKSQAYGFYGAGDPREDERLISALERERARLAVYM